MRQGAGPRALRGGRVDEDVGRELVGQLEAVLEPVDVHEHVVAGGREPAGPGRHHTRLLELQEQLRVHLCGLAEATDGRRDRFRGAGDERCDVHDALREGHGRAVAELVEAGNGGAVGATRWGG